MADTSYKRRFGDRKEGHLLRSLEPFYKFIPYVMPTRNDSMNFFSDSVECTEIDRWLRLKRTEGYKGMGILHLFIAAYVRTVAHCPGLNRFVSGQKIYARNNIEVVMTVKRAMTVDAPETTIKVVFDPKDTVFDVYRKLSEKIDEIKANDGDNNTEAVAGAMCKLPGLLLRFAVWVLKFMDYFGWIPQSLLNASPFHGSMIITDLGSLGIPPIYHHLYNFGNLPVFIAFGAKRRVVELDKAGVPVERKYFDYKVVVDERTIDGLYYATAFKYIKYYLRNPAALEIPPKEVKEDIL
jgi:hypothetical protein